MRYLFFFVVIFFAGCQQQEKKITAIQTSDGNNISFTDSGKGDTTLLFIHGWCINKEYWEGQIDYFTKSPNSFRVVTIDLPGFGASGKHRAEWTMKKYGEDVAGVIDALSLKNVVLIGHSMSGMIILEANDAHPADVIELIGIDNFQEQGRVHDEAVLKEIEAFFQTLRKDFPNENEKFARAGLFQASTDSTVRHRVVQDFREADPEAAIPVLHDLALAGAREGELLGKLNHPLLLVNSSALHTNEKTLAKQCRSSYQLFTVGPTGHYPMLENPSLFNETLLKAIRRK